MINSQPAKSGFVFNRLKKLDIPKNSILYLHVGLQNIHDITGLDYKDLSKSLLDSIWYLFQPQTILVPTFTYSFTKSGIFHRNFSKSEVGRFSAEVLKHFSKYRTPDPIFSVVDVTDYLSKLDHVDYTNDYGDNSLFKYLSDQNYISISFDREKFGITQFHYIEKLFNVNYRYDKIFKGIIYHDETNWEHVKYSYFVHGGKAYSRWNRPKIEKFLTDVGVVHKSQDDIGISWISAQDAIDSLRPKLLKDINYLIS